MLILILAIVLLILFLLWCLLLRPRRGQPGWEPFARARFAHRGLHDLPPPRRRTPWRPSAGRRSGAWGRSWTSTSWPTALWRWSTTAVCGGSAA